MKILFVCTGNTCRSSMASALAKELVKQSPMGETIEILSAGTAAWPGSYATPEAVLALRKKGIDLTAHRATLLTPELVAESDLILTMTETHRQQILQLVPEAKEKVYTLGEFATVKEEIKDPYGQAQAVYEACAQRMEELILKVLERLSKKNEPF